MGVALAILDTHSLIVSSHPLTENHRDILPVETRRHPSIDRLRGSSPHRPVVCDSSCAQVGTMAGSVITWYYLHTTLGE